MQLGGWYSLILEAGCDGAEANGRSVKEWEDEGMNGMVRGIV
jgi:hypothetical protein